ncbi:hypothetical protein NDU88_001612 [Pleurodeles waltl]|uniref:Uncharacterized protein n=1 Tax=Pleurodeles waltl TaxID=8319 RepID=A0AAV7U6X8_PLEWA|nr:hypothetical protein NDU88_001612 [Pleurodeles waltl]
MNLRWTDNRLPSAPAERPEEARLKSPPVRAAARSQPPPHLSFQCCLASRGFPRRGPEEGKGRPASCGEPSPALPSEACQHHVGEGSALGDTRTPCCLATATEGLHCVPWRREHAEQSRRGKCHV